MRIICKIFGHTFNHIEKSMLDIMQNAAENKEDFKNETIKCYICGDRFTFWKEEK